MAGTADHKLGKLTSPRGWFQIGSSAAIEQCKPQAIRFFGRDRVLYRGEGGRVVPDSAYCVHRRARLCRNTTSHVMRDSINIEGDQSV